MAIDADKRLLTDALLGVYRDIVPDPSALGDTLCRKLASGLFARGARIEIGITHPARYQTVHHSLDLQQRLVWTNKEWGLVLGHRPRAALGRSVTDILAPESRPVFLDYVWPTLLSTGRVASVDLVLVTAAGGLLPAAYSSEILRHSSGAFDRTFSKITVLLP